MKNITRLRLRQTAALLAGGAVLPLHAELVGHYQFEETTGTVLVDSSGNGRDGTLTGPGNLDISGAIGSAYQPGGAGGFGVITDGVTDFGIMSSLFMMDRVSILKRLAMSLMVMDWLFTSMGLR